MSARAAWAAAGLVLFAMTFAGHPLFAQGTAVVRGRVVAADTGLPLRRVSVALRSVSEKEGGQSASTDDEGAFAFEKVAKGRYRLSAMKTGYVVAALGARAPGRPGRAFDLANGQTLDGLTLRLSAAGVISGRVVDDAGEPVANATVMARRRRTVNGAARLEPGLIPRQTDDTGAYRLFGLPPGRYVLSAHPGDVQPRSHDLVDTSGTAFAITYHPSTPVPGDAQPIEVTGGVEAFADIALVPTRVTTVSGEVVDAAGRPAIDGFVDLAPADRGDRDGPGAPAHHSGVMRQGGAFTVSGVPPGDYTLTVHAFFDEAEMMHLATAGSLSGGFSMPLAVSGTPIAGLRIVVPTPIDLAGRVQFEGEPPGGGAAAVSIFATSKADGHMDGGRTQAGADGRFTLRMLPRAWRFIASTPPGWMMKRVIWRGRAVDPGEPIDIDAEPGGRLDILLTSRLTVVTGTASDTAGQPVVDYHAIVFPADRTRAHGYRTRLERADAQGRFRVEGLLPGEYVVAALADFEPHERLDDEFFESLRPGATPVRVAEGATEIVSLKVSPAP